MTLGQYNIIPRDCNSLLLKFYSHAHALWYASVCIYYIILYKCITENIGKPDLPIFFKNNNNYCYYDSIFRHG